MPGRPRSGRGHSYAHSRKAAPHRGGLVQADFGGGEKLREDEEVLELEKDL